jgi:hypothetical protein
MKHWKWNLAWMAMLFIVSTTPVFADDSAGGAGGALPYQYAWTKLEDVPVYSKPGDPSQMMPKRYLVAYYTWVSIEEELQADQKIWYRIQEDEYVLAEDVWIGPPTPLRGVQVPDERLPPVGFVVTDDLNVRARPGVSWLNPPIAELPRYTVVRILGQVAAEDSVWYRIGSQGSDAEGYVHSEYIRVVTMAARPSGIAADERWIAVDRAEQTIAAYEGDRMVFASLVSTGLPQWQTPDGLFRIWLKRRVGDMTGGTPDGAYYYLVEDVPWTMYFDGPYALHAAYWHDDFGYEHSRGCVNLSPHDARWLFDWTAGQVPSGETDLYLNKEILGTPVYVYSTAAAPGLANQAV